MANMPSLLKKILSVQVERTTIKKLDKMVAATGISRNSLINAILSDGTANVQLTEEDRKEIEDEIEEERQKRNS